MENVDIVLVNTRFPENIGAAARAMAVTGVSKLKLVNPEFYKGDVIASVATDIGIEIVKNIEIFSDFDEAVKDSAIVYATTVRSQGTLRSRAKSIFQLTPGVLEFIASGEKISFIFGSERDGLPNSMVKNADYLMFLPTENMKSMNLAQAVMTLLYTIYAQVREDIVSVSDRADMADYKSKQMMYNHLKSAFVSLSVSNKENSDNAVSMIKGFVEGKDLSLREVSFIRGISSQIIWWTNYIKNK